MPANGSNGVNGKAGPRSFPEGRWHSHPRQLAKICGPKSCLLAPHNAVWRNCGLALRTRDTCLLRHDSSRDAFRSSELPSHPSLLW